MRFFSYPFGWWNYLWDFHFGTMLIISAFSAFVGLMFGANSFAGYQCGNYARITGRPTHYQNFDQCYIQRDGKWYGEKEYLLAYAVSESLQD